MRRLDVDEAEIVRLYVEEGLRARAIAARIGCSNSVIYDRLDAAGVARVRSARVPHREAIELYTNAHWSTSRLAERYRVSRTAINSVLREAGVVVRGHVAAHQPGNRRPCPNNVVFRAYCLGLAAGDLWVHRVSERGETLIVSCSTTHAEQADLVDAVFRVYGPVYREANTVRASLDLSFSFLSEKYEDEVASWINGVEAEAAFASGYIDAEGSFGVYEGRGRFKLDSYDVHVLTWLHGWCRRVGVRSRLRMVATAGHSPGGRAPYRRDLWRLNVNEGQSLLRLVATLDPYVRHARRRAAMERVRANVLERLRNRAGHQEQQVLLVAGARGSRQIDFGGQISRNY